MDDNMTTIKKYQLKNLDCANCAQKIEDGVKGLDEVKFASVNFATATLHGGFRCSFHHWYRAELIF
jgi:Cd2+/Zn2+-exporting ATPase